MFSAKLKFIELNAATARCRGAPREHPHHDWLPRGDRADDVVVIVHCQADLLQSLTHCHRRSFLAAWTAGTNGAIRTAMIADDHQQLDQGEKPRRE